MFLFNMYESLYLTKLTSNALTNFFYMALTNFSATPSQLRVGLSAIIIIAFVCYYIYTYFSTYRPKVIIWNGIELDIVKLFGPSKYLKGYNTRDVLLVLVISFTFLHHFYPIIVATFISYFLYYTVGVVIAIIVSIFYMKSLNFDRRYFSFSMFYYLVDMYLLFIES